VKVSAVLNSRTSYLVHRTSCFLSPRGEDRVRGKLAIEMIIEAML